jgi:pimeloyl-ACP methyl ester carboxylesterase
MRERYPLVESFADGMLEVGDGNQIYWETSGNPDGKPVVVLHGGPGQGTVPGMRRGYDPDRYLIVLHDQRGCGRSTPSASDPSTDLSVNTTGRLISDLEKLREHLGIERWLVSGGSWGSTLGLAYAEQHPDRVTEIVLIAVTTGRRSESDWLYRRVAMFSLRRLSCSGRAPAIRPTIRRSRPGTPSCSPTPIPRSAWRRRPPGATGRTRCSRSNRRVRSAGLASGRLTIWSGSRDSVRITPCTAPSSKRESCCGTRDGWLAFPAC